MSAVPWRFYDNGIYKFNFHVSLSCAYNLHRAGSSELSMQDAMPNCSR